LGAVVFGAAVAVGAAVAAVEVGAVFSGLASSVLGALCAGVVVDFGVVGLAAVGFAAVGLAAGFAGAAAGTGAGSASRPFTSRSISLSCRSRTFAPDFCWILWVKVSLADAGTASIIAMAIIAAECFIVCKILGLDITKYLRI